MARRAFYSFHYEPDNWRASQIRNMGVIDGNKPATDNDWEEITDDGDKAIQKWIDDQLSGKSVAIILIGAKTAGRKWIKYEINKAWDESIVILGIFIHNLKDSDGDQTTKGKNSFADFNVGDVSMSSIVKAYDPPYSTSTNVYNHIKENLSDWIEEAISIRDEY